MSFDDERASNIEWITTVQTEREILRVPSPKEEIQIGGRPFRLDGTGAKVGVLDAGWPATFDRYLSHVEDLSGVGDVHDPDGTHASTIFRIIQAVAPGAELYAIRLLDEEGVLRHDRRFRQAMDRFIELGVHMVNISMVAQQRRANPYIQGAIQKAFEVGVILVVSAGNTNRGDADTLSVFMPADMEEVITVGAVRHVEGEVFQACEDSGRGGPNLSKPDVVALGHGPIQTTSFAAPYVTGAYAQWIGLAGFMRTEFGVEMDMSPSLLKQDLRRGARSDLRVVDLNGEELREPQRTYAIGSGLLCLPRMIENKISEYGKEAGETMKPLIIRRALPRKRVQEVQPPVRPSSGPVRGGHRKGYIWASGIISLASLFIGLATFLYRIGVWPSRCPEEEEGDRLRTQGAYEMAIEPYKTALEECTSLSAKKKLYDCYLATGKRFRMASMLEDSDEMFRKAAALYPEAVEPKKQLQRNQAQRGVPPPPGRVTGGGETPAPSGVEMGVVVDTLAASAPRSSEEAPSPARSTVASDSSWREAKWPQLLLATAVAGYGYTDARMLAFLLSVASDGMVSAPPADSVEAVDRFHNLIGFVRYLVGVCYENLSTLHLQSKEDFYRALMIGYNSGPGNLLQHGLDTPFEETQAYVGRIEESMQIWRVRIEQGDLVRSEATYRAMYERLHPPKAQEERAEPFTTTTYRPAQTREELVQLTLAVAVHYYRMDDPYMLAFVLSLVEAESNFDPKAKSWAQARGLGQLMDATAGDIVPWVTEESRYLYDPFVNLHLCIAYIEYLGRFAAARLDQLGVETTQDLFRAIMIGYNSGPGNLLKHKLDTPFEETQAYIRRIERRIPVWKERLTKEGFLQSEAFYEQVYVQNRPSFVAAE